MQSNPMQSHQTIRWAHADDAEAIAEIYAQSVVESVVSFEAVAPDADEMRARMARVQAAGPWLVCEQAGRVVGYSYAGRHRERAAYRWCLDGSIFVDRAHHRRGVGRALYGVLLSLARAQGYCAMHAGITLPNAASAGLHEAFGFRPVAVFPKVGWKLGAWHDVGWWQLELAARDAAPGALLTPDALRCERPEAWAAAFADDAAERPSALRC